VNTTELSGLRVGVAIGSDKCLVGPLAIGAELLGEIFHLIG